MLKKIKKTNIPMALVLPVVAVMMASELCGCGVPAAETPSVSVPSVSVSAPAQENDADIQVTNEETPASDSSSETHYSTVRDRWNQAMNGGSGNTGNTGNTGSAGSAAEPVADGSMDSASEIAKLADLKAPVQISRDKCFVNVGEDSHNPYDVTWDYGEDYQTYIDAVDDLGMWDVLFNADFYMENYPMLALQYHDNEALLLEHFQTVGVHEGRQASKAFNVAAYMENCSQALRGAFGDNYECYYFYWALNQKTESKINTASDGHPLQMEVVLTALQSLEFEKVNEYRVEAGVHDIILDPEFLAFAGFRAQQDFTGDYTGHEWMFSHVDETYEYLDLINADTLSENTVHGTCNANGPRRAYAYYRNYYNSPSHYAAMVSDNYFYFGCSNDYWGPDGNDGYKRAQYDVYTESLSTYMNP